MIFLVLCMAVLVHGKQRNWTPGTYPNPRTQSEECGRKNVTSLVCDPEGIIPFESANAVDAILSRVAVGGKPFAQAPCGTSGLKGFQIAVALMHRMYNSNDSSAAAKSFAYALQDAWGIGDPACDNGVLIFLALLQDQLVFATGAAVEALLSPEVIATIIKDVQVDVEEARYAAAIELAATRIGRALAEALQPHDDPHSGGGGGGGGGDGSSGHVLHWGLLVEELLLALGCVSAGFGALYQQYRRRVRSRRQFEDCRTTLEGIEEDHLKALQQRNGAVQTCCPLCLSHMNFSCTPSGVNFNLNVRPRPSTGDDGGTDDDDDDGGGDSVTSDEETGLRRPLKSAEVAAVATTATTAALHVKPGAMFPCGHAFCEPCVVSRINQGFLSCPICGCASQEGGSSGPPTEAAQASAVTAATAAPTTPAITTPLATTTTTSTTTSTSGAQVLLDQLRAQWEARSRNGSGPGAVAHLLGPAGNEVQFPMMIFRLRQLQRQYPQFLTLDMTIVWEQDLREGRELDAQQMRNFRRRDPTQRGDGLLGSWRVISRSASKLQGLRIWRRRR
ncbi:hypothetical protein Vretimale_13930 [Volvox reticuliferus]|uniref:Uncharacterized protein n=1 Tax=Volvox reticuliferus TaxID=1737510 RepID=A0A8J4CW83_9CHLO|nr:hypothetical protein Vretifemale_17780 [Volvox reticuliferus]GIM10176.1 hypothetical protein Vretimale_13930 [Volvox reticuliferus]